MILSNLTVTKVSPLSGTEVGWVIDSLVSNGFSVTKIENPEDYGTYVYFEYTPKCRDVEIENESLIRFIPKKDSVRLTGYIEIERELEGFTLNKDTGKQYRWIGLQYNRILNLNDVFIARQNSLKPARVWDLVPECTFGGYACGTEWTDLHIEDVLKRLSEKFIR